jgi:hypothetical protein
MRWEMTASFGLSAITSASNWRCQNYHFFILSLSRCDATFVAVLSPVQSLSPILHFSCQSHQNHRSRRVWKTPFQVEASQEAKNERTKKEERRSYSQHFSQATAGAKRVDFRNLPRIGDSELTKMATTATKATRARWAASVARG